MTYLSARSQTIVLSAVERQLGVQPTHETRNRKPMRPNPMATWELRIGKFRVYYAVNEGRKIVEIRAIGIKERNRVIIGGEEIRL